MHVAIDVYAGWGEKWSSWDGWKEWAGTQNQSHRSGSAGEEFRRANTTDQHQHWDWGTQQWSAGVEPTWHKHFNRTQTWDWEETLKDTPEAADMEALQAAPKEAPPTEEALQQAPEAMEAPKEALQQAPEAPEAMEAPKEAPKEAPET